MPTYEYQCKTCGNHFERLQRFSEAPITECPQCGGEVRRVIHPAGVIFKGSGWYITDSRQASNGDSKSSSSGDGGSKSASTASSDTSSTTSTTTAESKPAEKAPAAAKD